MNNYGHMLDNFINIELGGGTLQNSDIVMIPPRSMVSIILSESIPSRKNFFFFQIFGQFNNSTISL